VNGHQKVTYALDFYAGKQRGRDGKTLSERQPPAGDVTPRVARLMALAIRFEGLLREETIQDYAELARLGRVTRARMTQIMKLLDLAPDIQEQILFLPLIQGLNERSLRPLASRIDWAEQRRMFQKITWPCVYCFGALRPLPPRLSTGAATTGAGAGFNTVA
jgi:hypothetical protein